MPVLIGDTAKSAKKTAMNTAFKAQRMPRKPQRMPTTSGSLSSPDLNEQGGKQDDGHDSGLDNLGGDVRPFVIGLTGKTSSGAIDDSNARYGANAGTNLGLSSVSTESDEAQIASPLTKLKPE